MKVAVIGSGILGMKMAMKLHELEAAVTLFSKSDELGGKLSRMALFNPDYLLSTGTVKTFQEEELIVLAEKLEKSIPVKRVEVLRVNKRFLSPDEKIEGRSRLADLFRVVYRVDPSKLVESQKEENPELYKNFDPEMMKSLGEQMEAFEDFDLVVDATGKMENSKRMGPGGTAALNEIGLSHNENLFYGWESAELFKELPKGHILIAGEDEASAIAVLRLKQWLKEAGNSLTLLCEKDHPFRNLSSGVKEELDHFMGEEESAFVKKMEEYREKVFAWRELEEYEKAKIPMPTEPKPPFDVQVNAYITSVDKLIDKDGWFLTVESPEFKGQESLRTVRADAILVLKGFKKKTALSEDLQTDYNFSKSNSTDLSGLHPEPGFYSLESDELTQGLNKVEPIIENMLSFFSRIED